MKAISAWTPFSVFDVSLKRFWPQVPDPGYFGAGNFWTSRQVSEHEDARSCRGKGRQEQAGLLQSEYDGSDDPRTGMSLFPIYPARRSPA